MITLPEMIMIGGNSRNSGKTTMVCKIITNLAASHNVIGLKVTSVRPGEETKHGSHNEESLADFTIFEELDSESGKDTSRMLRAGASKVFYIRVSENFIEEAVLHFLSKYINKQIVVCESRSLRNIVVPGLFLMMIRTPAQSEDKDVEYYLSKADKVFHFNNSMAVLSKFADEIHLENGKFVLTTGCGLY